MKKLILLSVVAVLGFAGSKAMASGSSLILNVSGTAVFQKTAGTVGNFYKATTENVAINNKVVYNLISNAVENAEDIDVQATLPKDGWIVYVPGNSDGEVDGYFYATNKLGDNVYLSGFDSTDAYFSFIELDSYNDILGDIGFSDPFDGVYTENYNNTSESGSEGNTSTAVLYIHDDPYDYNDATQPDVFWDNDNAIEIRGVLKLNVTYKSGKIVSGSGSITGTGNMLLDDDNGVITSGRGSF